MATVFGRERELASIEAAVRRGLAGTGALVLLSGEPGIGKTRLAEHAAEVAAGAGASVSWGRCWEAGGAPAYWPWVLAFRGLGLATPFSDVGSHEAPADARFRAFDAAVQALQRRATQGPIALLLDDLHAADLPSLLLLQLLARGLRGHAIVVVGTYREVEARRNDSAYATLGKVARDGELVRLARLGARDLDAWLRELGQTVSAERLHELTEGNPLFVRELLRVGGALTSSARLGDGIGSVLDEHLARVSANTRELLEHAAILGREFATAELVELSGASARDVETALGGAAAADLLAAPQRGRWSFVHILVRDRLVDTLATGRRAELHAKAGEAMLAASGDLVTAAHHLIEGYPVATLERVLAVTRDASERCLAQLAFEAAAALGERALALSGPVPSRSVCALAVVVAEAYVRAGDLTLGRQRSVNAASMARTLGEKELLVRGALAYGALLASGIVDPTMVELLEDALEALPAADSAVRARVMARLASALTPPRPETLQRVISLGTEAIAMARRLGDEETLLYTLQFGMAAFGYLADFDARMALVTEVVELARRLKNRQAEVLVLGNYLAGLLEQGRHAEARDVHIAYEELLDHFPQPTYQWRRYLTRATLATLAGDTASASAAGDELQRLSDEGGFKPALLAWSFLQMAWWHGSETPRLAAPIADKVLSIMGTSPAIAPFRAWVLAAAGRNADAREVLEPLIRDDNGFPLLLAAGDAVVLLQDRQLAEARYAALAEHRGKNRMFWGPGGSLGLGPTARVLGDLALLLGRNAEAVAHFEAALADSERMASQPFIALSKRGLARARAALGSVESSPRPLATAAPRPVPALRRDGDVWTLSTEHGACLRLKDGKGVHYLERLLASAGQELHVLDLLGSDERPADAGAVLDAKAKEQYKCRLEDLRDQLDEATRLADTGRAARAQTEIDAIADALAAAVGLGGRDRVAASNVERARINVQRRLKDTLDRIAELDPALGRYLAAALRTGTFCSFTPL